MLLVLIIVALPKFPWTSFKGAISNEIGAKFATGWGHALTARFDFEDGVQGWQVRPQMMIGRAFSSDAHFWEGKRSLAIAFDRPYVRKSQIYVPNPPVAAGQTVSAYVRCPADSGITSIALFVEDGNDDWTNDWEPKSKLIPGTWNRLSVRIPSDAVLPFHRLGLEFQAESQWKGMCYLDAVEWR